MAHNRTFEQFKNAVQIIILESPKLQPPIIILNDLKSLPIAVTLDGLNKRSSKLPVVEFNFLRHIYFLQA